MKKFLFIAAVSVLLFSCGKPKNYEQQKSDFIDVYALYQDYLDANQTCKTTIDVGIEFLNNDEFENSVKYKVCKDDMGEVTDVLAMRNGKFGELKNAVDVYQEKYSVGDIEKFEKYYAKDGGNCTLGEINDSLLNGGWVRELADKYFDMYEGLLK